MNKERLLEQITLYGVANYDLGHANGQALGCGSYSSYLREGISQAKKDMEQITKVIHEILETLE